MTNPNPSGWADPTFGNSTSNPAGASEPASPGQPPSSPPSQPQPPVFGQASVPAYEPAPQWAANDGTYPGYAVPGYGAPYGYGQPMVVSKPTNGMAVAAMVVSIVGAAGLCAYGVGGLIGIVGAILGHVARRQIRERDEQGDGMALAGIIVGWIVAGLGIIGIAVIAFVIIAAVNTTPS
jgi:hypothetical protein